MNTPDQRGLELLRKGKRAFNHAKYLLDVGARVDSEAKARSSAETLRSAMDWLEDTDHFEIAHQALDHAGRFIRKSFGCQLTFRDNRYYQECPVALAHTRIGFSIAATVKKQSCSICGRDPHDCSHITGRMYDGERCVRIIEDAEIFEVSLVNRPSMPDARITSAPILDSELREQFGSKFRHGIRVSCDRCLSQCEGIYDPGADPLGVTARRQGGNLDEVL